MQVTIAKAHDNLFSGEALSVTVPTIEGEITVLPNHEAFVTTLKAGNITVHATGGDQTFAIESGVLEISSNQVTVLL